MLINEKAPNIPNGYDINSQKQDVLIGEMKQNIPREYNPITQKRDVLIGEVTQNVPRGSNTSKWYFDTCTNAHILACNEFLDDGDTNGLASDDDVNMSQRAEYDVESIQSSLGKDVIMESVGSAIDSDDCHNSASDNECGGRW